MSPGRISVFGTTSQTFLIPEQINWAPAKHLFLVHREDLAGFGARTETQETNILLKPFTRVTLAAFLGMGVSAPSACSLRADRDVMLQCLIQTNLRLQEYDQDRTNFLARAVHDFRAPLTALSGYCGLLLAEPLGPLSESQKEVLRRMQHSTRRLSRMASAMFQLSVGRQVKQRPGLQKGDIRACLDQAMHEIGPFADEKRIAVTAHMEPCEEPLYIDAEQIEQVLINILDNACKFTPKAGSDRDSWLPLLLGAADRSLRGGIIGRPFAAGTGKAQQLSSGHPGLGCGNSTRASGVHF